MEKGHEIQHVKREKPVLVRLTEDSAEN